MLAESEKQVTKRQHFVPQFYLRRFLNSKNEVEVLDCAQQKIIAPRGTRGICYEDFFYGIRTGELDEVSQAMEKAFQQVEDSIAGSLDEIISKILNNDQILIEEKWTIALLMSMLWIRGPMMRRQINDMSEHVTKEVMKRVFDHPGVSRLLDKFDKERGKTTDPETRREIQETMIEGNYSLDFSNVQHMRMFEGLEGYANLFCGQDWTVYISRSEKTFVTSGNPIVVIVPERVGPFGPTFLERTHYFALTPEICVEAKFPHKDTGKRLRRKTLFKSDEMRILSLNMILSGQAHEYVYARDRQSLEDILQMAKHLSALSKAPRQAGSNQDWKV